MDSTVQVHLTRKPTQRSNPLHWQLPPNYAIIRKPRQARATLRAQPSASPLPTEWDWRTAADPLTGKSLIMKPLNQKQCGSCYVFSSTECLRNRLALAGQNAALPNPSQQVAMDCSLNGDTLLGCSGGGLPEAMLDWLSKEWLPTSKQYPYTGKDGSCPAFHTNTASGYRGDGVYTLELGAPQSPTDGVVTAIKQELLTYGPLVASYLVYEDFLDYWLQGSSSDVYSYDGSSKLDGGHAVLVIGWGQQGNQLYSTTRSEYWLVMNSWGKGGPSGDGTFKIAVASSGTGIDTNMVGVYVSNAVDVYARNAWAWQSVSPPPPVRADPSAGSSVGVLLVSLFLLILLVLLLFYRR